MAVMTGSQTGAILWAQWRALRNYYFRRSSGVFTILTSLSLLVWYGLWVLAAVALAAAAADPESMAELASWLGGGLLLMFAFWQFVPIIMVSAGLSLDLSKLIVYPVPHGQLFGIEVALRVSTAAEMLIVTAGLAAGLARNPQLPWWAPLPLLPFAAFNLLLSAGLRDLVSRLSSRRYARELFVFVVVLLAALPQLVVLTGAEETIAEAARTGGGAWWPWSVAARLLAGDKDAAALALLLGWTAAAGVFGRWQFERSLRFDSAAARSTGRAAKRATSGPAFLPALLKDPMAVLIDRELRVLSRAPRFRLLFLMGFTFGLMIWLPMLLRGEAPESLLTLVSAYALLLLGEVCFWNIFGMDRTGVQTWFAAPVPLSSVIVAKNAAAACVIALEVAMVCVVCFVLRVPVTPGRVAEAFAAIAVLTLFLFAVGNIISVRHPRAVDPSQSWNRAGAGKVQAMLFLIYPLAGAPVLLAYGARYAFDHHAAFYAVLAVNAVIGAIVYQISLESATSTAYQRRESIIEALSRSESPIA